MYFAAVAKIISTALSVVLFLFFASFSQVKIFADIGIEDCTKMSSTFGSVALAVVIAVGVGVGVGVCIETDAKTPTEERTTPIDEDGRRTSVFYDCVCEPFLQQQSFVDVVDYIDILSPCGNFAYTEI